MTGLDRGENLRMRQVNARRVAGRGIGIEREAIAGLHYYGTAREGAKAEFGSLQINQDANRPAGVALHRTDHADQFAHAILTRVAHVDAENVGAGIEKARDHVGTGRGGSEGGDDFGAAQTSHGLTVPGGGGVSVVGGREGPSGTRGARGRSGACSAASVNCTVHDLCSPVSTSKNPVRS